MWQTLSYVLNSGPVLCAHFAPVSPYRSLDLGLVCGLDVPAGIELQLFLDTGLIHILVVSGAHLIFVERLCIGVPARAKLGILIFYCWLTGFGAPVLRALLRRVGTLTLAPWGWTRLQVEAAATLAILAVYPPWIFSRSFLMSWICALALQAPLPWSLPRWRGLGVSVRCYVFLFPFCPSSPLVIGWNCLLGPWMGELLFPLTVLAFALPFTTVVSDGLWTALLWLLAHGPHAPASAIFWPATWIWWIPLMVHVFMLWGEWKWRRAVAFLS